MVKTPAVLVCCLCEQVLKGGEYDYSKTQRGNMIYFHKSKKCPDKLEKNKGKASK